MTPEQQHAHLNILLADDDIDDCAFFKKALMDCPINTDCTTVHDGEQLMKQLTNDTNELPDVVFLDLNMPRKNGFECLEEIKHNEKLKRLPVIIFSTSLEQGVINTLYQNGAQHFIRKPSDFLQFKKIIQQSITLVAQGNISQPIRNKFVLQYKTN